MAFYSVNMVYIYKYRATPWDSPIFTLCVLTEDYCKLPV